jgi:hypothetical protein
MKKLITLLSILAFFSCKKDSLDEAPVEMLGSWQWVSTSGGITGRTTKVDSTKQFILTISPNKKYSWCRNGNCSSGTYSYGIHLIYDKSSSELSFIFSELPNEKEFPLSTSEPGMIPYVQNDSISFDMKCPDCVGFLFIRKK